MRTTALNALYYKLDKFPYLRKSLRVVKLRFLLFPAQGRTKAHFQLGSFASVEKGIAAVRDGGRESDDISASSSLIPVYAVQYKYVVYPLRAEYFPPGYEGLFSKPLSRWVGVRREADEGCYDNQGGDDNGGGGGEERDVSLEFFCFSLT